MNWQMQPPPGGSGWGAPPGAPPPPTPPGGGGPTGWSTPSTHGPPGGYGLALPPGVSAPRAYAHGGGGSTEPLGIVSLILGVLSIPLYFCCGVFGMVLNLVLNLTGIVLALVALSRAKSRPGQSKAIPIAGLVINGLLLLLSIGLIVFFVGIMGVGLLSSP